MIEVSDAIKSAFRSDEFHGNISLTIGTHQYTANNILNGSTTITESISSGEDIDFRVVEKSCLETSLINISEGISDLKGQTVTLSQRILNTDIPLGVYTIVDTVNNGDYLYKVTAYDNLSKFDVDVSDWWNNDVVFPISLRDLLISLCTEVNVQYDIPSEFTNSDFMVTKNISVENATGTDFLGYIQEASASFIRASRTGVITMLQLFYNEESVLYPSLTIYPSTSLYPTLDSSDSGEVVYDPQMIYTVPLTMEKLNIADYSVQKISKLQIRGSEEDVGVVVGEGDNAYIIEANPLFYSFTGSEQDSAVAQNIYSIISELTYTPVSTKVKTQPYIEVGDLVKFVSFEGKVAYAPLLYRQMGGFLLNSDVVESKGREKRDSTVQSVNKTTKVLNQRMHEVVNSVSEFRSTMTQVQSEISGIDTRVTNNESEISQTAEEIRTEVNQALANYATTEQVRTAIAQSANEILAGVWQTRQGEEVLQALLTLNKYGLTVFTDNADSVAQLNGNGVLVLKQVGEYNYIVAKFTKDVSYTNNLTAATFMRYGAHRWEAIEGEEFDGSYTIGSAAAWTGAQEALMEETEG